MSCNHEQPNRWINAKQSRFFFYSLQHSCFSSEVSHLFIIQLSRNKCSFFIGPTPPVHVLWSQMCNSKASEKLNFGKKKNHTTIRIDGHLLYSPSDSFYWIYSFCHFILGPNGQIRDSISITASNLSVIWCGRCVCVIRRFVRSILITSATKLNTGRARTCTEYSMQTTRTKSTTIFSVACFWSFSFFLSFFWFFLFYWLTRVFTKLNYCR